MFEKFILDFLVTSDSTKRRNTNDLLDMVSISLELNPFNQFSNYLSAQVVLSHFSPYEGITDECLTNEKLVGQRHIIQTIDHSTGSIQL